MTIFTERDAAHFVGIELVPSVIQKPRSLKKSSKINRVIQTVCDEFTIAREQILGPRRSRYLSRPRQIAFWLCRETTQASFPQIGMAFDRDHTTILHGCRQVDSWIIDAPLGSFERDLASIAQKLRGLLADRQ